MVSSTIAGVSLLLLSQTCSCACLDAANAGSCPNEALNSPGLSVLLQRSAPMQEHVAALAESAELRHGAIGSKEFSELESEVSENTRENLEKDTEAYVAVDAGSAETDSKDVADAESTVVMPMWAQTFLTILICGLLLLALSWTCHTGKGQAAIFCRSCGALFVIMSIVLLVLRGILLNIAGPEALEPAPQSPSATVLLVHTQVPFTASDLNTPGPVRNTYVEGMQTVLGDVWTVLSLEAVTANVTAQSVLQVQSPGITEDEGWKTAKAKAAEWQKQIDTNGDGVLGIQELKDFLIDKAQKAPDLLKARTLELNKGVEALKTGASAEQDRNATKAGDLDMQELKVFFLDPAEQTPDFLQAKAWKLKEGASAQADAIHKASDKDDDGKVTSKEAIDYFASRAKQFDSDYKERVSASAAKVTGEALHLAELEREKADEFLAKADAQEEEMPEEPDVWDKYKVEDSSAVDDDFEIAVVGREAAKKNKTPETVSKSADAFLKDTNASSMVLDKQSPVISVSRSIADAMAQAKESSGQKTGTSVTNATKEKSTSTSATNATKEKSTGKVQNATKKEEDENDDEDEKEEDENDDEDEKEEDENDDEDEIIAPENVDDAMAAAKKASGEGARAEVSANGTSALNATKKVAKTGRNATKKQEQETERETEKKTQKEKEEKKEEEEEDEEKGKEKQKEKEKGKGKDNVKENEREKEKAVKTAVGGSVADAMALAKKTSGESGEASEKSASATNATAKKAKETGNNSTNAKISTKVSIANNMSASEAVANYSSEKKSGATVVERSSSAMNATKGNASERAANVTKGKGAAKELVTKNTSATMSVAKNASDTQAGAKAVVAQNVSAGSVEGAASATNTTKIKTTETGKNATKSKASVKEFATKNTSATMSVAKNTSATKNTSAAMPVAKNASDTQASARNNSDDGLNATAEEDTSVEVANKSKAQVLAKASKNNAVAATNATSADDEGGAENQTTETEIFESAAAERRRIEKEKEAEAAAKVLAESIAAKKEAKKQKKIAAEGAKRAAAAKAKADAEAKKTTEEAMVAAKEAAKHKAQAEVAENETARELLAVRKASEDKVAAKAAAKAASELKADAEITAKKKVLAVRKVAQAAEVERAAAKEAEAKKAKEEAAAKKASKVKAVAEAAAKEATKELATVKKASEKKRAEAEKAASKRAETLYAIAEAEKKKVEAEGTMKLLKEQKAAAEAEIKKAHKGKAAAEAEAKKKTKEATKAEQQAAKQQRAADMAERQKAAAEKAARAAAERKAEAEERAEQGEYNRSVAKVTARREAEEARAAVHEAKAWKAEAQETEDRVAEEEAERVLEDAAGQVELKFYVNSNVTEAEALSLQAIRSVDFDAAVIQAAGVMLQNISGSTAPSSFKVLTEIQSGATPASSGTEVSIQVEAAFRCKALINMGDEVRALTRIVANRRAQDVKESLERVILPAASELSLELSPRCNDKSEDQAMQVCVNPNEAWIDFQTPKPMQLSSIPAGMSVDAFLCGTACSMSKILTAKKAEVVAGVNGQFFLGLDPETAVGDVMCAPVLPAEHQCTGLCE